MDIIKVIIILVTGAAAGFINVNAGGGSFLTIPMLIFMGLPPAVANGTNRIALTVASMVSVHNFKKSGFFEWKTALFFGIPMTLGAIGGSFISINLPDRIYTTVLAVMIIVVIAIIIVNPQRFIKEHPSEMSSKKRIAGIAIFFILGLYAGVIQAGVGFLIITSLVFLTGYSLVKINSLKVFIAMIYMVATLAVFIFSGNVNWLYALVLTIGNSTGALLGTRFAVKHGDKWIKAVMIVAALIMALRLLNVL
ncbi:MAG: sulfite exporter TauE/SafE family protein [Clostridia bacterium]|nr:sulfite exporter TauE/SafE family protein [Clostridia bacterium]